MNGQHSILFSLLYVSIYSQNSPLTNYIEEVPPTEINWIVDDLSGVTYNISNNRIYMIENDDGTIWELNQNFDFIRTITGDNLGDEEDIIYLNNNDFGVVTEEGKLFIGDIPEDMNSLEINNFQNIIFDQHENNSGAEGVAYDSLNKIFYIVKEKDPMAFYVFQRPNHINDTTISVHIPFDAETQFYGVTEDLSSITYDYRTNRVLIVSDESQKIIDVDPVDGTIYGELELDGMEQAEGICFLNDNYDLLIVGEPNYYTIFSNSLGIDNEIYEKEFSLYQNYPNPFNPITNISFFIKNESKIKFSIFDLNGKEVRTLLSGRINPGKKKITWDGYNNQSAKASSGTYIYKLIVDGHKKSKTMTYMK